MAPTAPLKTCRYCCKAKRRDSIMAPDKRELIVYFGGKPNFGKSFAVKNLYFVLCRTERCFIRSAEPQWSKGHW